MQLLFTVVFFFFFLVACEISLMVNRTKWGSETKALIFLSQSACLYAPSLFSDVVFFVFVLFALCDCLGHRGCCCAFVFDHCSVALHSGIVGKIVALV